VRQVGDASDRGVVLDRVHHHDARSAALGEGAYDLDRVRGRGRVRSHGPCPTLEQLGRRGHRSRALATGHGVPAHVARGIGSAAVGDGQHGQHLDAGDVGHDRVAPVVQRGHYLAGDVVRWNRDNHESDVLGPRCRAGAGRLRELGVVGGDVAQVDPAAGVRQRQGD